MKNLFRLSSQSKPNSDRYAPPAGPPPQQHSVPHGAAADYYGHAAPTYAPQPSTGSNYYPPPSAPPPSHGSGYASQMPPPGIENPLAILSRYDTVILVDDSGSMEMFWDETRDALIGVVQTAIQYDSDGIDVYFFNDHQAALNCNSPDAVRQVFTRVLPRRSTPTASSIKRIVDPYLVRLQQSKVGGPAVKPMNLIVLTDGAPDRGQDPEQVIVEAGRFLDSGRFPLNQLGISFIQIGDDQQAARHLAALDDDLRRKHSIRDFVDCTPYQNAVTSDFILKALIGGINRKVDNTRV